MKDEQVDGLVVAATAGASGVLAELAMGNGWAGTVAGGLVPIGMQAGHSLIEQVRQRRAQKVGKVLEAAGLLDAGLDILDERRAGYDERVELLARVMEAAARTTFEARIAALGRVLADGLALDAQTGEAIVLAAALSVVEPPHVSLLNLLDANRVPPGDAGLRGGKPVPGWPSDLLIEALPELGDILEGLASVLAGQGLVRDRPGETIGDTGTPYWQITPLGRRCLFMLDGQRPS